MTDKEKLAGMRKALEQVINYPPKGGRRTKDGYPSEIIYDDFAYKRMVDSVRNALREILEDYK